MIDKVVRFWRGLKKGSMYNQLKEENAILQSKIAELEKRTEFDGKQEEYVHSKFLKNIYHEIRTPLNSVVGLSNLLSKNQLIADKERGSYAEQINKSTKVFLKKIDDIIQASMLEAGVIKINPERCLLKELLEENHVFYSIKKHIEEKDRVALLLSFDHTLNNFEFVCDKYRVIQVLSHLLDNALKFTEKGVVEYGCKLEGEYVRFFVKDSSSVNLEGYEAYLFNKFSKVELESGDKGGLGLGLSICKDLVALMGGEIAYKKSSLHGNYFFFDVPIKPKSIGDYGQNATSKYASFKAQDLVKKRHSQIGL